MDCTGVYVLVDSRIWDEAVDDIEVVGEDGAVASNSFGGEVISMEDAAVRKRTNEHNQIPI